MKAEKNTKSLGIHIILDIGNCNVEKLNDVNFILSTLGKAAEAAKTKILQSSHHQFEPYGVTALLLLSESHTSIHTWPENGCATIDLYTCSHLDDRGKEAIQILIESFEARDFRIRTLFREIPGEDMQSAATLF